MSDLKKHLDIEMTNPEFFEEYKRLQPQLELKRLLIESRNNSHMTQAALSRVTGIRQSNISRIENGSCSPNLSTIQKLAEGLGKRLEIRFVDSKT
ncbi:MAG: helix-turn-helix transcriptional regulator [Bacillota bacterium]|nr:helix-turn-helix transcriptional regulator [Bacillota bacterium]